MFGTPPVSFDPLLSAVDGEEDAELGAQEEQLRLIVVLHQAPDEMPVGQVAADRGPCTTAVGALQDA
jgi:hypothetical protein